MLEPRVLMTPGRAGGCCVQVLTSLNATAHADGSFDIIVGPSQVLQWGGGGERDVRASLRSSPSMRGWLPCTALHSTAQRMCNACTLMHALQVAAAARSVAWCSISGGRAGQIRLDGRLHACLLRWRGQLRTPPPVDFLAPVQPSGLGAGVNYLPTVVPNQIFLILRVYYGGPEITGNSLVLPAVALQ